MIGIPQMLLLAGVFLEIGWVLANDGKTSRVSVTERLFGFGVLLGLLWWGGFFK